MGAVGHRFKLRMCLEISAENANLDFLEARRHDDMTMRTQAMREGTTSGIAENSKLKKLSKLARLCSLLSVVCHFISYMLFPR